MEYPDKSWRQITWILFGVSAALPAFYLSAIFIDQSSLLETVLGIVVSGGLWSSLASTFGRWGTLHRQSTFEMIIKSFNGYSATLPILLIFLSLIIWFAISLEILSEFYGKTLGFDTSLILKIIFGTIMTSSAAMGFKGLKRVSKSAAPLLIAYFLYLTTKIPEINIHWGGLTTRGFIRALSLSLPALLVGAVTFPDLSRLSKGQKDTTMASMLGFALIAPSILIFASIFTQVHIPKNWFNAVLDLGGVPSTLGIIFVAVWTTNDNNLYLYSSSLALKSITKKSRKGLAVASGALGTLFAVLGIGEIILPLLQYLPMFILPIVGIVFTCYNFKRNCKPKYVLFSYFISLIFGYGLICLSFTPSPYIELIATLSVIFVSGGIYYALSD